MKIKILAAVIGPAIIGFVSAGTAHADILLATPEHYSLKQEAISGLGPDAMWNRLIHPEIWWHPEHSYSGNSANLSLDAVAGGAWTETWGDGSVEHGRVLQVQTGKTLRLDAPFGPLQDLAVQVIWTITIEPYEDGSKVIFTEVANGTAASKLDALAPAVDFVKTEAIQRLTQTAQD